MNNCLIIQLIMITIYIISVIASMLYVRKILNQTDFWTDLIICICLSWLLVSFMIIHLIQVTYKKFKSKNKDLLNQK